MRPRLVHTNLQLWRRAASRAIRNNRRFVLVRRSLMKKRCGGPGMSRSAVVAPRRTRALASSASRSSLSPKLHVNFKAVYLTYGHY
ncbi:hypothetical protein B5X24_HaOG200986 [Helicoverpa armigera]|nr:hypothetical protein B5X24_HaOG200986 [Helicoverpa armigera]